MQYKVVKEEMGYYCSDMVYYIAFKNKWYNVWRYLLEKSGKVVFYDTRIAAEKHIESLKRSDVNFEKKLGVRTNVFLILINHLFRKHDDIG